MITNVRTNARIMFDGTRNKEQKTKNIRSSGKEEVDETNQQVFDVFPNDEAPTLIKKIKIVSVFFCFVFFFSYPFSDLEPAKCCGAYVNRTKRNVRERLSYILFTVCSIV